MSWWKVYGLKKITKLKENRIKNVRYLFWLEKEINDNIIKDIRNLLECKKKIKQSST